MCSAHKPTDLICTRMIHMYPSTYPHWLRIILISGLPFLCVARTLSIRSASAAHGKIRENVFGIEFCYTSTSLYFRQPTPMDRATAPISFQCAALLLPFPKLPHFIICVFCMFCTAFLLLHLFVIVLYVHSTRRIWSPLVFYRLHKIYDICGKTCYVLHLYYLWRVCAFPAYSFRSMQSINNLPRIHWVENGCNKKNIEKGQVHAKW